MTEERAGLSADLAEVWCELVTELAEALHPHLDEDEHERFAARCLVFGADLDRLASEVEALRVCLEETRRERDEARRDQARTFDGSYTRECRYSHNEECRGYAVARAARKAVDAAEGRVADLEAVARLAVAYFANDDAAETGVMLNLAAVLAGEPQ